MAAELRSQRQRNRRRPSQIAPVSLLGAITIVVLALQRMQIQARRFLRCHRHLLSSRVATKSDSGSCKRLHSAATLLSKLLQGCRLPISDPHRSRVTLSCSNARKQCTDSSYNVSTVPLSSCWLHCSFYRLLDFSGAEAYRRLSWGIGKQ